jgi:hypothetical protein
MRNQNDYEEPESYGNEEVETYEAYLVCEAADSYTLIGTCDGMDYSELKTLVDNSPRMDGHHYELLKKDCNTHYTTLGKLDSMRDLFIRQYAALGIKVK